MLHHAIKSSDPSALRGRMDRWTLGIILIGVALRLFRYFMRLPLNGDEAAVGLNIINRGFVGLLQPLDYAQVAPLGFLWSQRAVYDTLGMSEYAMRLLPLLGGIAALILFAVWARLIVNPFTAFIATGIVAVCNITVQRSVELKPYGYDLLASVLLLLPATLFLLRREDRWLIWLIGLTPLAMLFSYPAVFMCGAIGLTLIVHFRGLKRRSLGLIVVFGFLTVVCFAALLWTVSAGQYHRTTALMEVYWKDAFPPANPVKLMAWLIQVHTGSMFAYPVGSKNGASAISFLLFLIGLYYWLRERRPVPGLLLVPFALTMIAAAMQRYPYGQSDRCSQHLVPAIVLLISVGVASLIERFCKSERRLRNAQRFVMGLLLIIGAGVVVLNILHPGTREHFGSRDLAGKILDRAKQGAAVLVLEPRDETIVNVQWYLRSDDRVIWGVGRDLPTRYANGSLCVVTATDDPGLQSHLQTQLSRAPIDIWQRTLSPWGPARHWRVFIFGSAAAAHPSK